MPDFVHAIALFLRTKLSWRTCRRMTSDPHYRIVERDGFLYIEPRTGTNRLLTVDDVRGVTPTTPWPR